MNSIKEIIEKANSIVSECGTRNPFRIASMKGIHVLYREDFTNLYGMYAYILKNRYIFINENIPHNKQIIVCAHELGHDIFHRDIAKKQVLQEFALYDMQMRTEYEANVFAANLLIDEDDILDCIYSGYDSMQIANILKCDVNLVAIKVDCLIREGYKFKRQDYNSRFLKK